MKKTILTIALFLFFVAPTVVLSQSSAEELQTQKRLNEIEAKRATQSATVSAKKQNSEISFVEGTLTSSTNPTLVVSTNSGNKVVYTTDSTKFLNFDSKGKKLIGFGDLKLGEKILIIGLPQESASGTAKIIVRDQNPKPNNFSFMGKISEVSETTLTLNNFAQKELPVTKVGTTSSTVIKKANKTVKPTDFKVADKVVLTGTIDDKGTLLAQEIFKF